MDPRDIAVLIGDWGYPALLTLLLATALLSPIPEDLLLLASGYLVANGLFSWPAALSVCLAGVIVSDVLLYTWGTRIRRGADARWVGRLVPVGGLARAGEWFDRFGEQLVLLARLVPGTRAVTFVTAGARGVPVRRFLAYDVLGALAWVPLVLLLGSHLGDHIGGLELLLARVREIGGWAMLVVVALALLWALRRGEESKL